MSPAPPANIFPEAPETQAVTYFINHLVGDAYGAPPSYLRSLLAGPALPLFLKRCITALAFGFTSLDPRFVHFRYNSVNEYALATMEINSLIKKNSVFSSDQMLMALHCLYMWEVRAVLSQHMK